MSCERCGFTTYDHHHPDGHVSTKLGEVKWCIANGQRMRLCLGCVADLRREGFKVMVR